MQERICKVKLSRQFIVLVYVILMVTLFPLVFWNFYFDIADVKFIVFVSITLLFMCVYILFGIYKGDRLELRPGIARKVMLAWWGVNIVSMISSKYLSESFFGTDGRSFGVITVTCFVIMFLTVSSYRFNLRLIINIFICTAIAVSILAILNSFGIDFIGFYDGVEVDVRGFYQTTLGHVDICSSFYSIILPIVLIMFLKEKNSILNICYMVAFGVIFMGLFAGGCDSGYIIIAVMLIASIIFIGNYNQLMKLSLSGLIMIWSAKLLITLNGVTSGSKKMDSIAVMVTNNNVVCGVTVIALLFIAVCLIRKGAPQKEFRIVKGCILGIVAAAVLCGGSIFIYYTAIDKTSDIGSIANLVRFNDKWGSCRGYIWKRSLEFFATLSPLKMLVGAGPDTLQSALTPAYGKEMMKIFSAYYDNAHNEYIQYLVTTGALGLVTYIWLLVECFKNGIRNCRLDENYIPLIVAAVCYLIQAVVNINQILTTPFFFLVISLLAFEHQSE